MKDKKSKSYSNLFLLLAICLGILVSGGCVSVTGPTVQTSPGFVPKKVYSYGYDQMWDKVMSVLRRERIMLASADKGNGLITTDYIQGSTVDVAAISTTTYRHKYQIAFEKVGPLQTRVETTCKLEKKEMLKGGSAREAVEQLKQYEDVTYKMKKEAEQLEVWLYEQIEKSL